MPASTKPSAARAAALIATSLFVAAGCATQKGVALPDIGSWERRVQVLGEIDAFDFSGRIAVKAGDEGFNGKLRWQQQATAFRASVSGPLGVGTVRIEGDAAAVEVTDKDGVTTVLDDVEHDLRDRYGWTIPVVSLRYWALGIPDPQAAAETEFDATGALVGLRQRGWTVSVDQYRPAAGGQPMPRRLTAANFDTRVTLVIDRWVFHESIAPL